MICKKCRKEKLESDFYFRNKGKNIRHKSCKDCSEQKRNSKNHYLKYKDEYLIRTHLRNKRIREENQTNIFNFLTSHSCVDCGESDPIVLDFDHIDPTTKKKGVAEMLSSYNWNVIYQEILKCEVRCGNCHRRKTAKQFNHYRYLMSR